MNATRIYDQINQRLQSLKEYVRILRELTPIDDNQLKQDVSKRSIAERHLQLAAELLNERLGDFDDFAKQIAQFLIG